MDKEIALKLYYSLMKIRKTEMKVEELYQDDEMKTPVHLCLGEEAVSVAVCSQLKKEDMICSNHRSHGHYLAKGGDLKAMIAEFYCKETGCALGRGGSMHLIDKNVGHYGSSAIVGGGIPHAVGMGLAFQMQKKDLVAVAFLGDAASEQGVFFESMSMAALKKLPVVFVCENNCYSVCSYIDVRQPNADIYKRAHAFDIPSEQIDGMDMIASYDAAQRAIEYARSGKGPYLLEYRVQRWRGHAGNGDPSKELYRKPQDLDEKNWRDAILEFETYLLKQNIVEKNDFENIQQQIDQEVEEAFKFGQESPLPDIKELEKYLFAE